MAAITNPPQCDHDEWWTGPRGPRNVLEPVRNLLRNFPLLVMLALLPPGAQWTLAAAEKKESRPPLSAPPPPVPQQVKVPRDRKIDIPLRIYGKQNEPLRYLIKTQPAHGRLSVPRATENREVSMVTYEPPADLAITSDSFTFSVQSNAGVSAPVAVTIAISDEAPRLAMPDALEFGELLAGGTATRELQLTNRGGGKATGDLKLEPPWKIEGSTAYQLGAGESAYFKVHFVPTEGGQFRGEIRYTSDLDHTTALRGTAETPIVATPATVELKQDSGSAMRVGVFEIVNRTDVARVFELQAGTRLQVPGTVSVPAGGRVGVTVSVPGTDVGALAETVHIEAPGYSLSVPVQAAPVEAMLQVTPGNIPFGRLDAKRGGQLPISVKNVGGKPATGIGEIAAPFTLSPTSLELAPGEEKQMLLAIQPGPGGVFRTWLKLTGGQTLVEVEVTAELSEGAVSARPRSTRRAGTPGKAAAFVGEPTPWLPDLEVAQAIQVRDVKPTSASIQWPADLSPARTFRIERLILLLDPSGQPRNTWLAVPAVTFDREGALTVARVTGLIPQQSQTLRVVPLDAAGGPMRSLFKVDFFTPPVRSLLPKPNLLQWLILATVAFGGLVFWKRSRAPKHFAPAKTQRLA